MMRRRRQMTIHLMMMWMQMSMMIVGLRCRLRIDYATRRRTVLTQVRRIVAVQISSGCGGRHRRLVIRAERAVVVKGGIRRTVYGWRGRARGNAIHEIVVDRIAARYCRGGHRTPVVYRIRRGGGRGRGEARVVYLGLDTAEASVGSGDELFRATVTESGRFFVVQTGIAGVGQSRMQDVRYGEGHARMIVLMIDEVMLMVMVVEEMLLLMFEGTQRHFGSR